MPDHHVFAVASGKGGVGKTTTAVNLGAALAASGRSVVVVDADLGMANVTDLLAAETAGATLHDVLAGGVDAPAAAVPGPGGVDVVPGAASVESFADADPANIPDAVAALRERYDVVILDVGAGLSHDTVVPLGVADRVVVVTTPGTAAVRDARKTMELTERCDGEVAGVVVVDLGGPGDRTPDEVADVFDAPMLAAVPASPAVPESAEEGVPMREYAPDDAATRAYRDAAARLVGDPVPDDDAGGDDAPDEAASPGNADATLNDAADDPADENESDGDASDAESDAAGVVIEDAGVDAESAATESADDPVDGTVLDADGTPTDGDAAVPDDAMPTNLPGTEETEDGDAENGDDAGWLSRLTGGRLG